MCPPIPASTSSKTSVASLPSFAAPSSASITRESSPPEAISRTGPAGTPGFGAIRNSTASAPAGPGSSRASSETSKAASGIASSSSRSRDRLRQRTGRRLARGAQLRRPVGQLGSHSRQAPGRVLERDLGALELVAARAAASRACASTAASVPPCLRFRRSKSVEARLDLLEAPGLAVDRLGVAAQLGAQVVGLEPQAAQALGQGVELGVHAGHAVEQPLGLGQQRPRPALVGIRRERLRAARGRRAQRVEVAQPPALGLELAVLAVTQLRRLDLAQLPLEQVELAVARTGELAQRLELGLQVPGARERRRERGAALRLLGAAEAVEDVELRRGQRQAPVLVLAVEREQGGRRRRAGPARDAARPPR